MACGSGRCSHLAPWLYASQLFYGSSMGWPVAGIAISALAPPSQLATLTVLPVAVPLSQARRGCARYWACTIFTFGGVAGATVMVLGTDPPGPSGRLGPGWPPQRALNTCIGWQPQRSW